MKQKEKKRYSKTTWGGLSALSIQSLAECSEPFISVTLCQQANQRQWKRRCLSSRRSHAARSEDAELHCSYDGGDGGRVGAAGFMCRFQMLRNRQGSMMNGRRQPCCQSKVNSLSIRGGEMTPPTPTPTRACTSPAQNSSSNATAFDFCLCAFRTPVFGANPLLTSLSILILSFCACLG